MMRLEAVEIVLLRGHGDNPWTAYLYIPTYLSYRNNHGVSDAQPGQRRHQQ